jgi:hypothetical protein
MAWRDNRCIFDRTVLLFCRLKMLLQIGRYQYWKLPAEAIILSYEDFIVLAILSVASLSLCFLSSRLRRCIASTHCILIIFIASVWFINSIVQPLYYAPVSMSLLEYSGALNSGSINTLVGYLSVGNLVIVSTIFGLGPLAVYFSASMIRKINSYPPRINNFFVVATALYVPFLTRHFWV